MIIADMNSLFSNPEIFEDPLAFKPERFIDSSGKIVNQKLIIAFSIGTWFVCVNALVMCMLTNVKYYQEKEAVLENFLRMLQHSCFF